MEHDAIIREAEAEMRSAFPDATRLVTVRADPSEDDGYRPGDWFIAASLIVYTSAKIHFRLACVNTVTGERLIKTGWHAGQPLELAHVPLKPTHTQPPDPFPYPDRYAHRGAS